MYFILINSFLEIKFTSVLKKYAANFIVGLEPSYIYRWEAQRRTKQFWAREIQIFLNALSLGNCVFTNEYITV